MLANIVDVLADPTDGTPLVLDEQGNKLVSESGHHYDIARQGYVTLAGGAGLRYNGDDQDMITARETFLSSGLFAPFVEAVTGSIEAALDDAELAADDTATICEIGAGTGYYLSHVLDSISPSRGIGIDVSVHAAKRLAKCHPHAGAIVADAWSRLPIQDSSVDAISVVFAPRNAQEFARILKPQGEVVVLTADTGHLAELREPLGIIDVEPGKVDRMVEQAAAWLDLVAGPELVEFEMKLNQAAIAMQIGMSPSARHIHPQLLKERIAKLPPEMTVTARAMITRFGRKN